MPGLGMHVSEEVLEAVEMLHGGSQKMGGLTVIENDLLDLGESVWAGLCGCWVTLFDIALGVVA